VVSLFYLGIWLGLVTCSVLLFRHKGGWWKASSIILFVIAWLAPAYLAFAVI